MRTVERFALYLLAAYVAAHALDRAGAQEAGTEATPAPKTLRAGALEIRGANGTLVLRLAATSQGGGQIEVFNKAGKTAARLLARTDEDGELQLYDETGALRTTIGGNDVGGYANFYSRKGKLAAYVGGDSAKDGGYLAVMGPEGQKAIEAYTNPHGGTLAVTNGTTKKRVVNLGADPDTGSGLLAIANAGATAGALVYSSDDGGQFVALNTKGQKAAFLGVSSAPAGNGLVYIGRTDGQRLIEMGANKSGGGYMSVKNSRKERVIFIGASTGSAADDGVIEVERADGKLGVVLRAFKGGSSVRVYDDAEKVKVNVR